MLPTPPRDDAVSVSDKPENVYLKRTFTPLSMFTHQRTLLLLCNPDTQSSVWAIPPSSPRRSKQRLGHPAIPSLSQAIQEWGGVVVSQEAA